ncbi:hypothetical protein UA32_11745 [Photobacterium angustum]|uniref:Beta sliding clamp n=1 Tax=Photobacterium angustum TaxID=661 RepID=A0ABX5H235_PHOAN|nr:DNA polymerase III subunit beta [Photobacterium angustum]KJG37634.1 hypothetical protein UA32_11745 [Photobacterium angustum]PSX07090.1 DNA polymerase III subunit beta [Photobacterium angustum]
MELKFASAEVLSFFLSHPASITRKTDKDITEHIAIGATDQGVALIGTSDVCSFERIISNDMVDVIKTGTITINAKRLSDIARTYGKKPIHIILDDDGKTIKIKSGRSRLVVRETGNADKYPQPSSNMDVKDKLIVNIKQFQRGLKMCTHTMPSDHINKKLNGIHVAIKDNIFSFVSTDGHKLGVFKMPVNASNINSNELSFTLPVSAVKTLQSLTVESEDALIEISDNAMALTASSLRYQTLLIDGEYPDINKTIPTDIKGMVIVNKTELMSLIARSAIAVDSASKGTKAIPRLDITANLESNSLNTEVGQASDPLASDEIPIIHQQLNQTINTAMNYKNLLSCLQTISSEDVSLVFGKMVQKCQDSERLNLLVSPVGNNANESHFSMLMPMR